MKITTSNDDDFLYQKLLDLLQQIKLVQGGQALSSSLRRHTRIKMYLIQKQIDKIQHIEEKYFTEDGLNQLAIQNYYVKNTLQN